MKQIPKKTFDALLTITRKYWKLSNNDKSDLLECRHALGEVLAKEVGFDWIAILDFTSSILQYHGLNPNASNSTIYSALNVLGYEVVGDEEQTSKSL